MGEKMISSILLFGLVKAAVTGIYEGVDEAPPLVGGQQTVACANPHFLLDWTSEGEGGDGLLATPSYAVLAGVPAATNYQCGQMYAVQNLEGGFTYFMVAASEIQGSPDFYLGSNACALVDDNGTCDEKSLQTRYLPQLSSKFSYAAVNPPTVGGLPATICPEFDGHDWTSPGDGLSMGTAKDSIVTSRNIEFDIIPFCGSSYQFGDVFFQVKALYKDPDTFFPETGSIILDEKDCNDACEVQLCDETTPTGCTGGAAFPRVPDEEATPVDTTTVAPEDTTTTTTTTTTTNELVDPTTTDSAVFAVLAASLLAVLA